MKKQKIPSFWKPLNKTKPLFSFTHPVKLKQYPARTKKDFRLIDRNPWGDRDKDRVPNIFDCKPFNRFKQGKMLERERKAARRALIIGTAQHDAIENARATKELREHLEKSPGYHKGVKITSEFAPAIGNVMRDVFIDMDANEAYAKEMHGKRYYDLTPSERNKARRFLREVSKKYPREEIKLEAEKFRQTDEFKQMQKQKEEKFKRMKEEFKKSVGESAISSEDI